MVRPSIFSLLKDAIEDYKLTRELDGFAPKTVSDHYYILNKLMADLGPIKTGDITPSMIKTHLHKLKQAPKRGTGEWAQRWRHYALKGFFKFCLKEGYIQENPYTMDEPKVPDPVKPVFTPDELQAMLDCKTRNYDRDRAILLTLMDSGVRLKELAGMERSHIDFKEGTLLIPRPKNLSGRVVVLSRPTLKAIHSYLRTHDEPRVWLTEESKPITISGLSQIIKRISTESLGKASGPHKFRHTYAACFLDSGGDISALQSLLGHKTLKMVVDYAKATQDRRARIQGKQYSPVERLGLK
ncbi:MAG: tyrosine-type recombinase/integrase [Syntrophorhabdaceae bacterium]|nr:tyrosine-type recombinase/integrase [Syntrophorhabdaceae bacterium]